jgi:phosphoribosylpyrophosphate synthetase
MGINRMVDLDSQKVIFVDDIVTRGHTFMGAAWRLKKAFPNVEIRAFAAMQTISNKSEFNKYFYPAKGTINYRREIGDCIRRWNPVR